MHQHPNLFIENFLRDTGFFLNGIYYTMINLAISHLFKGGTGHIPLTNEVHHQIIVSNYVY